MKHFLCSLFMAVSLLAADQKPKQPVIDADTQIELLSIQVKMSAAERQVEVAQKEVTKLRADFQPVFEKAQKQCNGGMPTVNETKLVCTPKPEPAKPILKP